MAATSNPTVRRLELATRLRQLRLEAGRSVEEAATELMCSVAKISRLETAGRGIAPRDVRDLCRFYGVPDSVRDDLIQAANDARRPGWWQDFRSIDEQVKTFVGLEDAAVAVRVFDLTRVPGLLQTSAYTRALLGRLRPEGELTPEWIDETVELRSRRQERIRRGDLTLEAIIDEAVLRRTIGSPDVMADQVERLIDEAARSNVTLHLVPFARGEYPGLDGSFQHLTFAQGNIDDFVMVEGLLGNFLVDKASEVSRYLLVFEDLVSQYALTEDDSVAWLADFQHELRRQATTG